ncbi:MAG TPA: 1,4-alpha-glucan branching protein GlgB [Candidatus Fimousia stercorigallinarum]|nr:1,4-alpha-glucan branching protein GlgB [Candidatus Fimousia stercorigallinarum]
MLKEVKELKMSELDQYLFGQGNHYDIYKKLGAHPAIKDGKEGVWFAVWAPNARYISVVGNFNGWDRGANPMEKTGTVGIWETFIPGLKEGELYKFCVNNFHGWDVLKADPFGTSTELRPGNASKVASIDGFSWKDTDWMQQRADKEMTEQPMFIYEVHPGSWKKHPYSSENPQGFYNYKEFAHSLTEYVLEMGYTHVELIGIAEHPFDGSWGYQVTNYYAPTSRHGSPKDFMYLVDYLHQNGIGVILDWVPAHFPKDEHGLSEFDGTCQYEYADYQKANHPQWGTKIFDYGKNEVRNFLIANALYWIREYHVDGLRVDAVASMLYLDFGREPGQWRPNQFGDHRNLEAIEFIKQLNQVIQEERNGAMIIAEESTAWPKITGDIEDGGLGFSFKWNMGWMNDFLKYMEMDPIYRQYHHQKMNFSMMYAYNEKFILVLSHDEVVHMKHSMLEKMPGPIWDKFANLRSAYTYMAGHPGKKLLFMGQDFGQIREWSEEREIDWFLLADGRHASMKQYMKDLIHLYREHPCMYELDCREEGFCWVNADDNSRSIFSFERHSKDGKDHLLFICNFTPVNRMDYRVGAYRGSSYKLILNSDDLKYGGGGMHPEEVMILQAEKEPADNREYSIAFPLPAYAAVIFSFDRPEADDVAEKDEK